MKLNTENQEEAAKLILKVTGQNGKIGKKKACKLITHPEKGAYKNSRDARKFLKKAVKDHQFPLSSKPGIIQRTDIEVDA